MTYKEITYCPASLVEEPRGKYSKNSLNRIFNGRSVDCILPYESPLSNRSTTKLFNENRNSISISGVQEKFSVLLDKNKLRLVRDGEQGQYILKPIPSSGKNNDQMPANEHLTMQIARQVFGIETAENALIFFKNGDPAYITKRFDVRDDGSKWAQEDFASLAGMTPYTHGDNYKYLGNYLELFALLEKYVPAYAIEAPKLFKLILFNYLIANGDAHYKNFSLLETELGDFKLSPAYDLLNSKIHINDKDFALDDGLLPKRDAKGKIKARFYLLGSLAGIPHSQVNKIISTLTSKEDEVKELINHSYLNERTKRFYMQVYLGRLNKLRRI
jgi:serine/threonine-protein kinase HipA